MTTRSTAVLLLCKGVVPPLFSVLFQLFVRNVRSHHCIYHQLSETDKVIDIAINAGSKVLKLTFHQNLPGKVHRILLSHRLPLILDRAFCSQLYKLSICQSTVPNIMYQSRKDNRKVQEWI